ncbi:MAG: hypothetical protein ACRDOJ_13115 [Nocardioidaceae bacterium]
MYDEQVLTGPRGWFTVAVSTPEDRPANARRACGVNWLAWGARPDGVLIMRNQLPSPRFDHAIHDVERPGQEGRVLGSYLPRGSYTSPGHFQGRGCQAPSRSSGLTAR